MLYNMEYATNAEIASRNILCSQRSVLKLSGAAWPGCKARLSG